MRGLAQKLKALASPPAKAELPDPTEYSTLDNPLEVPRQKEAYYYILNHVVDEGNQVLDVGFGLGYGLSILSIKAGRVYGAEVDPKAIEYVEGELLGRNPRLKEVKQYDGYKLPYPDKFFDVITSIDVLEHVEDYDRLVDELLRLAKTAVIFATPLRRPEYTNPDGSPKNYYHLREWSWPELDTILKKHQARLEWRLINGPPDGPYTVSSKEQADSLVLMPILWTK